LFARGISLRSSAKNATVKRWGKLLKEDEEPFYHHELLYDYTYCDIVKD